MDPQILGEKMVDLGLKFLFFVISEGGCTNFTELSVCVLQIKSQSTILITKANPPPKEFFVPYFPLISLQKSKGAFDSESVVRMKFLKENQNN